MVKIGQVGVGYWGPNLLRNLNANNNCIVHTVVDKSPERRSFVKNLYPNINVTRNLNDLLFNEFPDKIKEVRGKGLLTAFEMQNDPKLNGHHVSIELLKRGVYAKETHCSTVRIAPALTIQAWQIDEIAEARFLPQL